MIIIGKSANAMNVDRRVGDGVDSDDNSMYCSEVPKVMLEEMLWADFNVRYILI